VTPGPDTLAAPLRIFHFIGGPEQGDAARFILQMAETLEARSLRMAAVLPERGPLEEELRSRHIPVRILPLTPFNAPLTVPRLARLLREWKPHLVQGHGLRSNLCARLASKGIPVISTFHTPFQDRPFLSRWGGAVADLLTASRSAAVVCSAECVRDDYLQRCPDMWEKTHVIPQAIDIERLDPRHQDREGARRALDLGGRWTLLVVGRLASQKGHRNLLQTLNLLKNTLPPFRLLFAGDGPLRGRLRREAARLGLGDNTLFLGRRRDVPALLAAADAVLAPSLSDDVPHSLLEALAMGKPVIASRVGGIMEIMPSGEEGYLVPPQSREKLAEALLTVLWNKEDARVKAQNGRRHVREAYDLTKILGKWETLYRSLSGDLLIR
jgi:glycosyltransferase involved in cell wall biosynthesis